MLAEAKKLAAARGLANFRTARARAEDLPFPDMSFDLVTCRLATYHFENASAFVAEAFRVLMPSGVFALVDNISPDEAELAVSFAIRVTAVVLALPSGRRCSAVWDSPSSTASAWTRTSSSDHGSSACAAQIQRSRGSKPCWPTNLWRGTSCSTHRIAACTNYSRGRSLAPTLASSLTPQPAKSRRRLVQQYRFFATSRSLVPPISANRGLSPVTRLKTWPECHLSGKLTSRSEIASRRGSKEP